MRSVGCKGSLAAAVVALFAAGCAGVTGIDALSVVSSDGTDAAMMVDDDARPPVDGADGGQGPFADGRAPDTGIASDSGPAVPDTGAAPIDSGAPVVDSSASPTGPMSCVPLGVAPCASSNQNCLEDPSAPDADPLNPPAVCLTVTGGLGQGEPCSSSSECGVGLDCIGDPEAGGYACQWMCYDSVGAIVTPPPFDAGVLTAMVGRGGCPAFQLCEPVNGYPEWLGACSSGN